jgi:hypothetical protein
MTDEEWAFLEEWADKMSSIMIAAKGVPQNEINGHNLAEVSLAGLRELYEKFEMDVFEDWPEA